MTYHRLFYLKYKKGISTRELFERFPEHVDRVSEVALLDLPEDLLKEVLDRQDHFDHLMTLKKQYGKFLPDRGHR